jgi:FG-GAP-like repeat/Bacterial pre-peptidase C-terminal domain/Leishmanolysin
MTPDLSTSSPIARAEDLVAIWYDSNTNATTWTRMSGSTIVERQKVANIPTLDWKLAATGDFNNDGQIDLLWRNQYTGDSQWWLMKEGKIIGAQAIQTIADQKWQIAGAGDFNRDGQLDILWRHQNGDNVVWIMPTTDSSQALQPLRGQLLKSVDSTWDIASVGDVNQDGDADILWVHRPTGSAQWWQMQQGKIIGASSLSDRLSANQQITTSTDLNGDGALDLVVKDVTSVTSDLWMMSKADINGTISTISRSVVTPDPRLGQSVGWQIAGVAKMMDVGNTLADAAVLDTSGSSIRSQTIGGLNDRADVYKFNLSTAGRFTASLSGLSADADLRLIQDRDGNGLIDIGNGEVLDWKWERGTKDEVLTNVLQPGSYFLEVRSYDDKLTNYQLATSFPTANTLAQSAPAPKLDIQFNFDATSTQLDQTTKTALKAAEDFWEGVLVGGGTLLPGGILPIRISLENLNLKTGDPDNLTLAYTAPQVGSSDGKTLIIQSANLTINRRRLGTIEAKGLEDLFIHELTHALGFGTLWEPLKFRMADGSIRSIGAAADNKSLIDRTNNTYIANSNAGWAYGELLRDAKRATTLQQTAVPIEAGFAAHWDESIFQTESLTPVANSGTQPISILTLAALKDLGWQVNFGKAQAYQLPTPSTGPSLDYTNVNRPIAAGSVMAANWVTEWPVG